MIELPKNIEGKIIGFTCSSFDILHSGYLLMLEDCKKNCDYLIVGLHNDPSIEKPITKKKPIQSIVERYIQLRAVKYIDNIVIYNTEKDLKDLLNILPITVRFCSSEYENKYLTGKDICKERNIEIMYRKNNNYFKKKDYIKKLTISLYNNDKV